MPVALQHTWRRFLLAPGGSPAEVPAQAPSRIACNCFGMNEARIEAGLAGNAGRMVA